MALISIAEIIDIIIMVLATGYIFLPERTWPAYKTMMMVTGPAIVCHELAHKFVAILVGLQATIHASMFGLGLGIALRAIGSPFVFFVPGFASIAGSMAPWQNLVISVAGPATNGILYLVSSHMLKKSVGQSHISKHYMLLTLTKKVNGFLFVLNMIPILGFDGSHVLSALLRML